MKILVVSVFVVLLALNAWLFLIRPKKPLIERVSFVFQLVGVYTLGLGVIAQTDLFKFMKVGEDMTSANLFDFAAGNLRFIGVIFVISSLSSNFLDFFYLPALFAYAVLHLLIVMPLAYIFYVIASVPIDGILHSTTDFIVHGTNLSLKAFVAANAVSLKSFLVALPTLVLPVSTKMLTLYKRDP